MDRPSASARDDTPESGAAARLGPLRAAMTALWVGGAASAGVFLFVGPSPWFALVPLTGCGLTHWLASARFRAWRARHQRRVRAAERALSPDADVTQSDSEPAPLDAEVERLASAAMSLARRVEEAALEVDNLRGVLDAVHEPVITVGPDGSVLLTNRAADDLFAGRVGPAGAPTMLEDLLPQAEVASLFASAAGGEFAFGSLRLSRAGGQLRIYEVTATPLDLRGAEDERGRGVVLTLRDTTELATAVQLKTDFVANASHELRTPLSSIRAAAETLTDFAGDDPSMVRRMVEMIGGNVARLEELVADLLDLSRIESPDAPVEYETLDVRAVVESLGELFSGVMQERSLTLSIDLAPGFERVRTSRRLLDVTLKNLIDNALKFADAGTTVTVRGRVTGADPSAPPGVARSEWRGVRMEVIDKGLGIPLDQQARVFERFHQVDPARVGSPRRRGTGLGLAIVKHAVRKLGGSVGVDSVWREGSTFWIELPSCVEPGAALSARD